MMSDDVFDGVAAAVRSTFHVSADVPITPQTTAIDIDGWDSLSHSILIMRVEEAFGTELPFDRIYDLADVGALAELVRAVREERA
jgi:acyl carrier protein